MMKLVVILFMFFSTIVGAQDFQITNVPQETMAPPPSKVVTTLQTSTRVDLTSNQMDLDSKEEPNHTIHPPKKALTLDEFEEVLKMQNIEGTIPSTKSIENLESKSIKKPNHEE